MVRFSYVIRDEFGLHARPAGLMAKLASGFHSTIRVKCGSAEADAKRLIALMKLGVRQNDEVQFEIEGDDEQEAAVALKRFMHENL